MKMCLFAGRVFLSRRDAESFARRLPDSIVWNVEDSPGGHYLIVLDGDIDAVKRICNNACIRTFICKEH